MIPTETAGPYPGDGTNGPNALTIAGIERSDIRTSIGSASGTAAGVVFQLTLALVRASSCEPLAGHAVYLWHCSQTGNDSLYTGDAASENDLRGVQVTDTSGQVTFTTSFPDCYSSRWSHIHFEIYASLAQAVSGNATLAVSQLALPKATCDQVYATSGYSASITTLAQASLSTDPPRRRADRRGRRIGYAAARRSPGTSRALIGPPPRFQPSRSSQLRGVRTTIGSYVSRIGHIHG